MSQIHRNKNIVLTVIVVVLNILVSWSVIGPVMNNNLVVQDDFRQCCFWFWNSWDPELFKDDFFVPMYKAQIMKTPLLFLLYKIAPFFTSNLIQYTKVLALLISIFTGITGFFFFCTLLRHYKTFTSRFGSVTILGTQVELIEIISVVFSITLLVTTWCTDHISIAHSRSFVWLFLMLHMLLKIRGYNITANSLIFVSLFISPHAFLIIFTMEIFDQVIKRKKNFIDFRQPDFLLWIANGFSAFLLHVVILGGKQTQGVGTPFSVAEMKALPEFNPGGRHPIFGSSIFDGTWWTNEHWGLGIGYLKISEIVIWCFWACLVYLIFYLYQRSKKPAKVFYNSPKLILFSQPAILLYASISLYFASQLAFPMLYLPSRYLAVPSLLLSLIAMLLLIPIWMHEFTSTFTKKNSTIVLTLLLLFAGFAYWSHFKNFYHTRYVSIDARINSLLQSLPPQSLIAGHPLLPDLNIASITSKRSVFVDYERSMAYTKESLAEIRRRNEVALRMVYASSREEFLSLARANGITHFLAHYAFYQPSYINNPVYMAPYDGLLRELTQQDINNYFIKQLLEREGQAYALIDISNLET